MKSLPFVVAVGLFFVFGACACAHQAATRKVEAPWVGPEGAPTESGIGPFGAGGPGMTSPAVGPEGPTGPVNFLQPWGQLNINTGTGLEATSEFTLFSGRLGGFPSDEGIELCGPSKGKKRSVPAQPGEGGKMKGE